MNPLRAMIRRQLLRALARRRGEVRAIQDLRHLQEVARFAAVFAITMLLPALALSWLALSSIRSEELSLDAELRGRAKALSGQLNDQLGEVFTRFEGKVDERLQRGESPLGTNAELSPFLRASFRFNSEGELVAPFSLPTARPAAIHTAAWQAVARAARAQEGAGDFRAAAASWLEAIQVSRTAGEEASARLQLARVTAAAGDVREAETLLSDLYSDHAGLLDARGFRFGDLAVLERARLRIARDPDLSAGALQDLSDRLLTDHWALGFEAEPTILRRTLTMLDGHIDPDWLASARARLSDRYAQLVWSEQLVEELELVYSQIPEGEFRYLGARVDSPSLWALRRVDGDLYAFSFDAAALYTELRRSAAALDDIDAELQTSLLVSGQSAPESAMATRNLGPWLPVVTVSVAPKDPAGLLGQKQRRRRARIAIVLIAVFMVSFGILNAARIISKEMENARMKADFAANVSHELRSPITQIRLKGESLQLGLAEPGEDMQNHFDAIVREAERLSRLVDNVLDFAAIERGAKTYQLRPDDLLSLVWTQAEIHRAAVEERGLELELDLPDSLPKIWFDREAIGQVLTNLMSNASKYGASGGWLGVRLTDDDNGVHLSVSDRGVGIAPHEVGQVFDEFFRSANPEVRRRKGTGIGLAIVRYIVEAHGGDVQVESTLGAGTTFTITLPLVPPDEGPGDRA